MIDTYPKNTKLTLTASVILQNNITVKTYEWTINNLIHPENKNSIIINTNTLNIGTNNISIRVLNSCGTWSEYVTKTINIINEVINMEQTFIVVVDKPVTNVEVIMQQKGIVIVTVKDTFGKPIPNATVTIDNTSSITDTSGVATLNSISYGTKTCTVTIL